MAELLPQNIPIQQSSALANYNYTDIQSGTGVIVFYPTITNEQTLGEGFILSENALGTSRANANFTGSDIDFDISFNATRNIKGTVYLSGFCDYVSGAGLVLGIKLRKVSGGVETEICATTLASHTCAADTCILVPLPLTAEVHFAPGDTLRMTLTTSGGTGSFIIDPTQIYTSNPTMKLHVPFKLNL